VGDAFKRVLEADADELRGLRREQAAEEPNASRSEDLKSKLGVPAPADEAIDADFEVDPDGPESP
jgi:hypothetical protein